MQNSKKESLFYADCNNTCRINKSIIMSNNNIPSLVGGIHDYYSKYGFKKIGSGSYGAVYDARRSPVTPSTPWVALKRIKVSDPRESYDEREDRLNKMSYFDAWAEEGKGVVSSAHVENEVRCMQIAQKLHLSTIVRFHHAISFARIDGDEYWIEMELIPGGGNMTTLLMHMRRLWRNDKVEFGATLLHHVDTCIRTMDALHSIKIVHHDMNSYGNWLWRKSSSDNEMGELVLIDFSISAVVQNVNRKEESYLPTPRERDCSDLGKLLIKLLFDCVIDMSKRAPNSSEMMNKAFLETLDTRFERHWTRDTRLAIDHMYDLCAAAGRAW